MACHDEEMVRDLIDPSHDVRENGFGKDEHGVDPHTTGWYCARCQAYTCALCPEGATDDDDELKAPCAGKPWWDREGV